MSEDWGAVKARLEVEAECTRPCDECGIKPTDIRAALERVEERETTECREILRLRQRVEELERERWYSAETRERELQKRAEAAEAKLLALTYENKLLWDKAEAAEAKLARCVEVLQEILDLGHEEGTDEIDGQPVSRCYPTCSACRAEVALAAAKGE